MTASRNLIAPRRAWSAFELEVMRLHYPITTAANLAELFSRPLSSVHRKARMLGLAKVDGFAAEIGRQRMTPDHPARAHVFPKGHAPANKGLRRPGWTAGDMARTQFKKGRPAHEAANYVPIGSHKITKDGQLVRKVTDDPSIVPVRRWVAVSRLVWIAKHGEIPAKHMVAFKPGLRTTVLEEITLERLECISMAENCRRNSYHNHGPEISGIVHLRAAITRQINQRKKESQ